MLKFAAVFSLYHTSTIAQSLFNVQRDFYLEQKLDSDVDYFFQLRSPNELPFFEPEKVTPLPSGTMRELTMILKELRVLTDKLKADEDDDSIENDWKFAAMVLDRLCLLTFTAFTIIATIAVLLAAPHIIVT